MKKKAPVASPLIPAPCFFRFLTFTPFFLLIASGFCETVQTSTATGQTIQYDGLTGIAIVQGNAKVQNSTGTLTADKITVDSFSKQGEAQGNVTLIDSSGTLKGSSATYNWQTSTGAVTNAMGISPPWRFTANRLNAVGPGVYQLYDGGFTSCDENPPHYEMRSQRAQIVVGKRATMYDSRFVLGDTPTFWTPYYTRTLKPRKYSLLIEPGQSARDGTTVRTIFGYPFSDNTYTKIKWDYLQNTGDGIGIEHHYGLPNVNGDLDTYYIRDLLTGTRRESIFWNHYQKFTPRLTLHSRVDYKSDQDFSNDFRDTGNQVPIENQVSGLLSESGFSYQLPKATLQADINRHDRFDNTLSSHAFISQLTLPSLSLNTIPLIWKKFPVYTSFTGTFLNQTIERTTPDQSLAYQRTAALGAQLKKDIRFNRATTLTPRLGYTETWQNRDLSSTTFSADPFFAGRYSTGLDLRRRLTRSLDSTFSYNRVARLKRNGFNSDSVADDHGIETNSVSLTLYRSIGRNTRVTVGSGYDFRQAPFSNPDQYKHVSARVSPPFLDLQYEVMRDVTLYFRETYSVFDQFSQNSIRYPLNTSGEIQFGNGIDPTFFSQGFSFTKTPPGQDASLLLTNKFKFYLTPRWYIDAFISYNAVPTNRIDYRRFLPVEKTISVVRDLHCWLLRMTFSDRPGRREAYFYVDLKANLSAQNNIFTSNGLSMYGDRTMEKGEGQIFPQTVPPPVAPPPPPK